MVVGTDNDHAYVVPMTYRGAPLDGAEHARIGRSEHRVLGTRWIYDGEHDPVLHAQLVALVRGEVVAQAQTMSDAVDPTVVAVPADAVAIRIQRRLGDSEIQPPDAGSVSATWQRLDGSMARAVVVSAA